MAETWDSATTVVQRLRASGAVIVGKSNVAMMLQDYGQTTNPLHGRTTNPWAPGSCAGGSSGGAAAAPAAGLTYRDYGSDLVGSIRIPAANCGVYGLKPTVGTVPTNGLQPPGPFGPPTCGSPSPSPEDPNHLPRSRAGGG